MRLSQEQMDLDQLIRFNGRAHEMLRAIDESKALESSRDELKIELDAVGSVREVEEIQKEMDECQLQL